MGRLVEQKGHLTLLSSLAILAAQDIECELVLVGDGPLREEIEEFVQSAKLTSRVSLVGWQNGSQVAEHIERARCMTLPSFAEGLPVVIMEAFAMGRPVISTYIAGIPELVKDGENGWLTAAGDAEGLATSIRHCLDTPVTQLKLMADRGKERVREFHSAEIEANRLANAITERLTNARH